jgi:hypothetical protein
MLEGSLVGRTNKGAPNTQARGGESVLVHTGAGKKGFLRGGCRFVFLDRIFVSSPGFGGWRGEGGG